MDPAFISFAVLLGIILCLVLVQVLLNSVHPLRKTIKNVLAGIMTLFAVNLAGSVTGITIPISLLSIGTSAVVGVPGVTLMLALNLI